MQLDHTHVAIRLRTLSEIGDLAMVMIRRYPASLLIGFAAGASVWAIANVLLIGWIPIREASFGLNDEEATGEVFRYLTWMALLVIMQTPAAGVLTTLYLGQAVFEHRPTWKSVVLDAKRQFGRWFWVLGIKRLAIPTMIFLGLRWGQPFSGWWDVALPITLVLTVAVVRSSRPFMPEILLLEQCPLRSPSKSVITMARRSKSLHRPMASDLGGRFLAVSFVFLVLFFTVFNTLMGVRWIFVGNWGMMNLFVLLVLYPLALWVIAGVSVLVRLLGYLDTRIRLEGWEVELAVRAEAMRQFGDSTNPPPLQEQTTASVPSHTTQSASSKEEPILDAVAVTTASEAGS